MDSRRPPPSEASILFLASLLVGAIAFFVYLFLVASDIDRIQGTFVSPTRPAFWPAVALGVLVTLIWPFLGWFAVAISGGLRLWAYANEVDEWTRGQRIGLAAIWPLT